MGSVTASDQTAALVAAFRRDGFVHAPALLTPAEVAAFVAAVDAAVESRKRGDTRALGEKSPYEQSFLQCEYLWEDFPAVRPLTFHPRIAGLAATLLGAPAVRLWHDQALYKEAGGRETDAHQDHAYWPVNELDMITAWIALTDIDREMGAMGYVAGSQHAECEFVDIFSKPGSGKDLEARHPPATFVPCKAGEVIYHGARTVHMAGPNRSDRPRRVHTAIYFADGCTRAARGDHPSLIRNATAPGAKIEGPATPIAWPLPGGALPTPAPWPQLGGLYGRAAALGVLPKASPA
jgi:hypothetical protein